ncbi:YhfX family PLP-dependent enzyme [Lelliottia wanjuensis]|uniref:YhfX family PLP-dependent enzyme n=1 Tax=Lelliottia wanjuensis TaxID=3050585 RepID=A0AAP4D3V2_9ENTR|nr:MULTISPECIES: YhfX family PLP-dependent enzyme [unclassified Lelliottia]MDK9363428.1 YhfX family PLP-dependent enzyme [Lelliottia sp. V106_12]MDK9617070.1 YhfX family PLP-dependent enzyme [Lelliottia sp. V106_9]
MFTGALKAQNPALIEAACELWRQGAILPDTWVIDVDRVMENGRLLLETAARHGITLYLMTKQLGRNPWLAQKLIELGFPGTVAVDFKEARTLRKADVPVSHVGHLVQIPKSQITENVLAPVEMITVFSLEKAREISAAALENGRVQPIMLKVFDPQDRLYPGQEAGFSLAVLDEVVPVIRSLAGVKLAGLTHFPCLLWDDEQQQTLPTPNLHTLLKARDRLLAQGVELEQLNAPSASSCSTLALLASFGVTHAEPGHALTGTIPANQHGDQPERIAMLYLTEVSHHFQGNSYCFGGGYYRRGHAQNALVYPLQGHTSIPASLLPMDESSIDYHIPLAGEFPVGSPVVMCFRTQIFVTRSDVALVSGISRSAPVLEAVYDSLGNPVSGGGNE